MKSIITYSMLALHESGSMQQNQDAYPRYYYFYFKLDGHEHIYLLDAYIDVVTLANSSKI